MSINHISGTEYSIVFFKKKKQPFYVKAHGNTGVLWKSRTHGAGLIPYPITRTHGTKTMRSKVGLELLQAILLAFQNSHQGGYSTISSLIGCLREITFLI